MNFCRILVILFGKLLVFHFWVIAWFLLPSNLTSAILVEPSPRVLTMCYLIERNTTGMTYDYNRARVALDLAKNYANQYILDPNKLQLASVYRDIGRTCDGQTHLISVALDLKSRGTNCDVYIGPGCGTALEIFNNLISVWDIPAMGCPASGLGMTADSAEYLQVSRTSFTYVGITVALYRFFRQFNYTSPAVFQDQSVNFFQQLGLLMESTMKRLSNDLRYQAHFYRIYSGNDAISKSNNTVKDIQDMIIRAGLSSRVYVICAAASLVRKFMVSNYQCNRAVAMWSHGFGMTNGDYIFIAIELYPSDVWGPYTWQVNDATDSTARDAYKSLALLSLKVDNTDDAAEFWRQVREISNTTYHYTITDKYDPVVAHFYDAVVVYAMTVASMAEQGLNYSSGNDLSNQIGNRTYQSPVTGSVVFDVESDRLMVYDMRFFNRKSGQHDIIFRYPESNDMVEVLGKLKWFGISDQLPANTPRCGFDGLNHICDPVHTKMSSGSQAAIVVIAFLFILIVGVFVYRTTKKLMYRNLDQFFWRILEQDMTICSADHTTASVAHDVDQSDKDSDSEVIVKQDLSATAGLTATLKNNTMVSLHELPEPKQRAPSNIFRDALLIRSMEHNNLQRFLGIAVDDGNICEYIVTEVCQKGSLHELLDNQRINLDWEFKNALIKDLTNGIVYIHSSPIQSHGFLCDTACHIDSRFVLKISDYGLPCLRRTEDLEAYHISQEETRNVRLLLWRAPEHLRRACPPCGTQKGDIYSFAILLQQIVLRTRPFHKAQHQHHTAGKERTVLNPAEIVEDVCRGLAPPLRPPIPVSSCSQGLHDLIELCWNEDPQLRPAGARIRAIIQTAIKKSGDNIVDHLIRRMEVYAADLENQILKKTKEFMDERHRAAEILHEILPLPVAEALSKGRKVTPELYPSTTVYCGSVIGFKDAVTRSRTPRESVHLLNALYSVCDVVMVGLDVFKVEVILDAYLVVSGLPVKNGLRHVEQIANMALQLRKEVTAFAVACKEPLKLRVGIHSGPCVAGVVGLKMPRYCLFGETVNTASGMEHQGEAGKIHVTSASKALLDLHQDFVLVERGPTEIKGADRATTYWLVAKH